MGLATTRPAGSASTNETPVRVTSLFGGVEKEFGFVSVKLTNVVPPTVVELGRNSLLMVGGLATKRLAVAKFPVPPLVDDTAPVVLSYSPVKDAVTFAVIVQVEFAVTVPPVRLTEPVPAVAVAVPPQLLVSPFGVATTRLAGNESVNWTPSRSVEGFGLLRVIVRVLTPFG